MIATLIVEDDPVASAALTRFVAHVPGFTVVGVAASVTAARAVAAQRRPQLALIDISLPDGNGLELAAELRGGCTGTDVIVVTSRSDLYAVRAAIRSGALHYLVKPVRLAALSQLLRRYQALQRDLAVEGLVSQPQIDRLFGTLHAPAEQLPKGLSEPTLDAVRETLRSGPDLSAAELADRLGVSRPTAGRYLEHLVQSGVAEVELRYGQRGRPQRRYRALG
ncbi:MULTISPECIES: response regulator [Kitasatospora]|uniref:Transcriptional regulatory protein n=1 Tax=Kitasatospora cystarginea TaxID=58350 RepID=A0ABP5R450_9ACTN